MKQTPTNWISIAQRVQAISQTGIAYAQNAYDVERYTELSEIAAAIMAGPEPLGIALPKELFAAQAGYATPKVDVRGAVFQNGRVLLVRESEDGCWTFPRMGRGWRERRGVGRARGSRRIRLSRQGGQAAGLLGSQQTPAPGHSVPRLQVPVPLRNPRRRPGGQFGNHRGWLLYGGSDPTVIDHPHSRRTGPFRVRLSVRPSRPDGV